MYSAIAQQNACTTGYDNVCLRSLFSHYDFALFYFIPFPPIAEGNLSFHLFYSYSLLIFEFSVPSKGSSTKSADMVKLEPMMRLVLHCIDRVRRFKLGKEVGCCYVL